MALDPNLQEQRQLADTFERLRAGMTGREIAADVVAGAGLVMAVTAIWRLDPPGSFALIPALASWLVLVAATAVRIDTPLGFTVPSQLAFVPLLFAVPGAVVPIAVAVALMCTRIPAVVQGEMRPSRVLSIAPNAWYAVGPVAVFAIAGVPAQAASAPLLLAAFAAQFACDFSASAARLLAARGTGLISQLRETWVYCVDAALSGTGLVLARGIHHSPWAILALLPLLGVLAVFARERRERLSGLLELNSAYHGTAIVLNHVLEADDGYTGEHCRSVVELTLEVGRRLGLKAPRLRNLEFAALLHDIGKIVVPKEIVNKPGKLTAEEWEIMQTHTTEGQKMLDRVGGFMSEVGLIVRSHHERWDGAGYPDGLLGADVPLEARIISCCDAWNAMRTDRSYRKALSYEVAFTELLANTGTQFDPHVAATLMAVVAAENEPAGGDRSAGRAGAHGLAARTSVESAPDFARDGR